MYDLRQVFPIFPQWSTVTLTRRDVEGIAHLARLEIAEAEMPVYVDSLSAILAFVEQLTAAATGDVEPMAHPLESQVQPLRADAVTETDHREDYQAKHPPSMLASTSCRRSSNEPASATAAELGRGLAARKFSSVELTLHLLDRIETRDRNSTRSSP